LKIFWICAANQYKEYSESKQRDVKQRRGEKIRWYGFRTQSIRREVARKLGDVYDKAIEYSRDQTLPQEERRRWARLATAIAQTLTPY